MSKIDWSRVTNCVAGENGLEVSMLGEAPVMVPYGELGASRLHMPCPPGTTWNMTTGQCQSGFILKGYALQPPAQYRFSVQRKVNGSVFDQYSTGGVTLQVVANAAIGKPWPAGTDFSKAEVCVTPLNPAPGTPTATMCFATVGYYGGGGGNQLSG